MLNRRYPGMNRSLVRNNVRLRPVTTSLTGFSSPCRPHIEIEQCRALRAATCDGGECEQRGEESAADHSEGAGAGVCAGDGAGVGPGVGNGALLPGARVFGASGLKATLPAKSKLLTTIRSLLLAVRASTGSMQNPRAITR